MQSTGIAIAGVDEVGRGALAGPVFAAAVILHPKRPIAGIRDSKRLSPRARNDLAAQIQALAQSCALGQASVAEITQLNILQASLLAMRRAVEALDCAPQLVRVDGIHAPTVSCSCQTVIGGDACHVEISAASILAKVARDQLMVQLHTQYPHYNFAKNKGYPTAEHRAALAKYGATDCHRPSFSTVRNARLAAPTPDRA